MARKGETKQRLTDMLLPGRILRMKDSEVNRKIYIRALLNEPHDDDILVVFCWYSGGKWVYSCARYEEFEPWDKYGCLFREWKTHIKNKEDK